MLYDDKNSLCIADLYVDRRPAGCLRDLLGPGLVHIDALKAQPYHWPLDKMLNLDRLEHLTLQSETESRDNIGKQSD